MFYKCPCAPTVWPKGKSAPYWLRSSIFLPKDEILVIASLALIISTCFFFSTKKFVSSSFSFLFFSSCFYNRYSFFYPLLSRHETCELELKLFKDSQTSSSDSVITHCWTYLTFKNVCTLFIIFDLKNTLSLLHNKSNIHFLKCTHIDHINLKGRLKSYEIKLPHTQKLNRLLPDQTFSLFWHFPFRLEQFLDHWLMFNEHFLLEFYIVWIKIWIKAQCHKI